jgi:hypothetical protein
MVADATAYTLAAAHTLAGAYRLAGAHSLAGAYRLAGTHHVAGADRIAGADRHPIAGADASIELLNMVIDFALAGRSLVAGRTHIVTNASSNRLAGTNHMALASAAAGITGIVEQQQIDGGARTILSLSIAFIRAHGHYRHAGRDRHAFHELTPVYIALAQRDNLVDFRLLTLFFFIRIHAMHPLTLLVSS